MDTGDTQLRQALLKIYNSKCFYTGVPIDFDTLQIDHVIPKSLESKPNILRDYLSQLDLPSDFDLDAVYNLVPCKNRINQNKGADLLPVSTARYYLSIAKKNSDAVLNLINEYKQRKRSNKRVESVREAVRSGHLGAEEVYDQISDDKDPFEIDRRLGVDSFVRSTSAIRLTGYVPTYNRVTGSCLITFRSLKIRDCMITLDHEQILSDLFVGLKTDPLLELRGFIAYKSDEESLYLVDLGNNRFPLTEDEVNQLCIIVDDYAEQYLKSWQNIENILGNYLFLKSKNEENGCKLVKVKRGLWRAMIEFSAKFDFENGDTPWHMFDSSHAMIKIYSKTETAQYDEGYHAFLIPEADDSLYFTEPDDEVWIIWDPDIVTLEGTSRIGTRGTWDAETTYVWLLEEFIPYVVFNQMSEDKKRRLNFSNFKAQFSADEYIVESGRKKTHKILKEINTPSDLCELLANLQEFYIRMNFSKYFIAKNQIQSLYNALILCLKRTPLENYGYTSSKLNIKNREASLDEILAELLIRKDKASDEVITGSRIEMMLRPMVVAVRENKSYLSKQEIQEIVNNLTHLVELKNLLDAIDRAKVSDGR